LASPAAVNDFIGVAVFADKDDLIHINATLASVAIFKYPARCPLGAIIRLL